MDELRILLQENLNTEFVSAVLSNPRRKDETEKVRVRPLLKKGGLIFQIEAFRNRQAFHENLPAAEACRELLRHMENMRQLQLETTEKLYTVLVSKKGKVTIKKKDRVGSVKLPQLEHNRKKHYILEEGVTVPFLVDLGVMTKDGKIVHSRYDKFRQINRFLEFIEDVLPQLDQRRKWKSARKSEGNQNQAEGKHEELTILDFGCGKSYLTFAMYYYLHELKGYHIRIIGLDLKREVISHCNELAQKYGYKKLKFLEGNIADYTGVDQVDMVVTLHACDTATDFALAKAIGWNAKVILSVPCCQHELNRQIQNEILEPMLKYGLIKERMAALVTDALRAEYLEREGYDVQILEFIDMEHTPKNILIRAVKSGRQGENQESIRRCETFLHVSPTLGRLLEDKGES